MTHIYHFPAISCRYITVDLTEILLRSRDLSYKNAVYLLRHLTYSFMSVGFCGAHGIVVWNIEDTLHSPLVGASILLMGF